MKDKLIKIAFVILIVACSINPRPAFAEMPVVFQHGENDIKYSFTKWPLAILLSSSVVALSLYDYDQWMQDSYGDKKFGKFDKVMEYVGEFYTLDAASLFVYLGGTLAKDEKIKLTGETLLEALLITQGLTLFVKTTVARSRPNNNTMSFPSSHASSSFCVASVLEVLHGPKFGIPAYLMASLISFTKFDSKSHYTTDLLVGAALGTTIGLGTALFHKHGLEKVHIIPMAGMINGLSISVDL